MMAIVSVALAVLLQSCQAVRICSAWKKSSGPCPDFKIGLLKGSFDAQFKRHPPDSIFLYSHFATSHFDLLPHFVKHYTALGMERDRFLLVWNVKPEENSTLPDLFEELGVVVVRWFGVFTSAAAHYNKIKLLANVPPLSWLVYADIDEFLELSVTVQEQAAYLRTNNFTHQMAYTIDRVAPGGQLVRLMPDREIQAQFPLRCNLTGAHGAASKVVLLRGDLRTVSGNHIVHDDQLYVRNKQTAPSHGVERRESPQVLQLSHYKWTHDVVAYLQNRVNFYKQVHQYWALSLSILSSLRQTNWTINVDKYCRE